MRFAKAKQNRLNIFFRNSAGSYIIISSLPKAFGTNHHIIAW